MEKSSIVRPNPWCQEEIWKTVRGLEAGLSYVDNLWFPTAIRFTVSHNAVVVEDEGTRNSMELMKGLIIVKTYPCTMFVTSHEVELYQCTIEKYEKGRWIHFSKNIVPFLDKEYYEAEEIYERLRHIFKVLAGYITDKLGF